MRKYLNEKVNPVFERLIIELLIETPEDFVNSNIFIPKLSIPSHSPIIIIKLFLYIVWQIVNEFLILFIFNVCRYNFQLNGYKIKVEELPMVNIFLSIKGLKKL